MSKGKSLRRSLWLQEALAREPEDGEPLGQKLRADVCIVGGGYTGLWTALRIKELEPAAEVVLVEADICGAGPSGRNGGFALSWWPKIQTLIERFGEEEALRLARQSEEAVEELSAFCEQEAPEASFVRGGWLWTATSPAQLGSWEGAVRLAEGLGATPFTILGAEAVQARTGSPLHLGAAFEPAVAKVHPGFLARALRRVALARGVRVFERSPLIELRRAEGVVRTPAGRVEADAVVLAVGTHLAGYREVRRAIVPLSSDMVATEPMPERLEESGWTGGECVSNCRLMVHYYRTTPDGRIAFGRGGGRLAFDGRVSSKFDWNRRQTGELMRELPWLVPAARGVRLTHSWGGPIDRTTDGLPFFGSFRGDRRVVYGAGFSGNGVAPCLTAGKILASNALGRDDEWSSSPLNSGPAGKFPPEPFRFVGGLVVRSAVRRKERREDRGAGVDPVTRKLASYAPSGFFRVNR